MSTINYLTISTAEILKRRFRKQKTKLQKSNDISLKDFAEYVAANEPSFNCYDGFEAIRNVWNGRTSNIRLTELLTEYEKHLS